MLWLILLSLSLSPLEETAWDVCRTRDKVPYPHPSCGRLDFDVDGDVDADDWGVLQRKPRVVHAEIIWCWRVESLEPLIQIRPEEILRARTRPAK